jgi:hypothetical protein
VVAAARNHFAEAPGVETSIDFPRPPGFEPTRNEGWRLSVVKPWLLLWQKLTGRISLALADSWSPNGPGESLPPESPSLGTPYIAPGAMKGQ